MICVPTPAQCQGRDSFWSLQVDIRSHQFWSVGDIWSRWLTLKTARSYWSSDSRRLKRKGLGGGWWLDECVCGMGGRCYPNPIFAAQFKFNEIRLSDLIKSCDSNRRKVQIKVGRAKKSNSLQYLRLWWDRSKVSGSRNKISAAPSHDVEVKMSEGRLHL